jgi:hypothetical protein
MIRLQCERHEYSHYLSFAKFQPDFASLEGLYQVGVSVQQKTLTFTEPHQTPSLPGPERLNLLLGVRGG